MCNASYTPDAALLHVGGDGEEMVDELANQHRVLRPFMAPIYALADPIPNAAAIPGGADTLPLGPFVLPLP